MYYSLINSMNRATTPSYLLDSYGAAAAAYSLRKLSNTYSGNAIIVRRSNDNAELGIGFDGSGNLDTTSLLSFCGANSGYVTTWYDQSGNSLNASQSTASFQPLIVASGVVNTQNAKPSLKTDGNDYMSFNIGATSNPLSIFSCAKTTSIGSYQYEWSLGSAWTSAFQTYSSGYLNGNNSYFLWQGSGVFSGGVLSQNVFYLKTVLHLTGTTKHFFYKNNVAQTTDNYTTNISTNGIGNLFKDGSGSNSQNFYGNCSEIIFYKSDQTSNVNNINTNINNYYAIY